MIFLSYINISIYFPIIYKPIKRIIISNNEYDNILANATELFLTQRCDTISYSLTVPNLSQFRHISVIVGYYYENIMNASSISTIPMSLFKSGKVRPQGDLYDGSERRYAFLAYNNDTSVQVMYATNLTGYFYFQGLGIKY